jgi:hypothetical protein
MTVPVTCPAGAAAADDRRVCHGTSPDRTVGWARGHASPADMTGNPVAEAAVMVAFTFRPVMGPRRDACISVDPEASALVRACLRVGADTLVEIMPMGRG